MAEDPKQPQDAAGRAEQRRARKRVRRSWRAKQREKRAAARADAPAASAVVGPDEGSQTTRRVRRGIVTSAKPDKTITVRIDLPRPHRIYKKVVRASSSLRAHDEHNQASEGDTVRVVESRPQSRNKRWRLVEVVERAR